MTYFLRIIILVILVKGTAFANDTIPAFIGPKAQESLLTDIVNNGQYLVAVGKRGNILYQAINADKNTQWQQASVPVQSLLTASYFTTQDLGWAVGHDATILHTKDGGVSWQIQNYQPELDKPLLDIYFTDRNNGYAIGAYGLFYYTKDAGKSWHKRFLSSLLFSEDRSYLEELKTQDPEGYEIETASILPHFNQITSHQNILIMAGEQGLVAKSADKGVTWERIEEFYSGSIFDLKVLNNDVLLAAGLRGNIFASRDHGLNWQHIKSNSYATINQIIVTAKGAILLANSGVILNYDNNTVSIKQIADGKANMAGVLMDKQLILARDSGIKVVGAE